MFKILLSLNDPPQPPLYGPHTWVTQGSHTWVTLCDIKFLFSNIHYSFKDMFLKY